MLLLQSRNVALAAQAVSLVWHLLSACTSAALALPMALLTASLRTVIRYTPADGKALFYEGTVHHTRRKPTHHSFRCGAAERTWMRSTKSCRWSP